MEPLLAALEGLLPQLRENPMPILDAIFQFIAVRTTFFADKATADNIAALARRYMPTKDRRLFRLFSSAKDEDFYLLSHGYALISVVQSVPGMSKEGAPATNMLVGKELHFFPEECAAPVGHAQQCYWPLPLVKPAIPPDEPNQHPILLFLGSKETIGMHLVQQGVILGKATIHLERGLFKPSFVWARVQLANSQAAEILVKISIRFDGEPSSSTTAAHHNNHQNASNSNHIVSNGTTSSGNSGPSPGRPAVDLTPYPHPNNNNNNNGGGGAGGGGSGFMNSNTSGRSAAVVGVAAASPPSHNNNNSNNHHNHHHPPPNHPHASPSAPYRHTAAKLRDRLGFPLPKPFTTVAGKPIDIALTRRNQAALDRASSEALAAFGDVMRIGLDSLKTLAMEFGFPHVLRATLWRRALLQRCTYLTPSPRSQSLPENYACGGLTHTEIKLDVGRTLPTHPFFSDPQGLESLRRVLLSTCSDTGVTYCQAMNYIAAMLLLLCEEDGAFWMLGCIVTQLLPDYFGFNILGVQVDINVLEALLDEQLPELRLQLLRLNYPVSMFASQWLMCLYVGTTPSDTLLRIWDVFFTHGRDALVAVALALLRMHQGYLESLDEIATLHEGLRSAVAATYDVHTLLDDVAKILATKRIGVLRSRFEEAVEKRTRQAQVTHLLCATKFTHSQLMALHSFFAKEACTFHTRSGEVVRGDKDGVASAIRLVHEVALSRDRFQRLLVRIHPVAFGSADFQELLFTAFDMNADGSVDFNEVCNGLSVFVKADPPLRKRAELLFSCVDHDTDGKITRDQFVKIMSVMHKEMNATEPSPEQVEGWQACFNNATSSSSESEPGQMTISEFCTICEQVEGLVSFFEVRARMVESSLVADVTEELPPPLPTPASPGLEIVPPTTPPGSSQKQGWHPPKPGSRSSPHALLGMAGATVIKREVVTEERARTPKESRLSGGGGGGGVSWSQSRSSTGSDDVDRSEDGGRLSSTRGSLAQALDAAAAEEAAVDHDDRDDDGGEVGWNAIVTTI